MKILFIGNHDNINRKHALWFSKLGHHVRHLVNQHDLSGRRNRFDWEGVSQIPSYTKIYKHHKWNLLYPAKDLVQEAKKCDLIVTNGVSIIPALALEKPTMLIPSGSDVAQTPFLTSSFYHELRGYLFRKRKEWIKGVYASQDDVMWASKLIGCGDRFFYYPLPLDCYEDRKNIDREFLSKLEGMYDDVDHLIFLPARKNLNKKFVDYKGQEKALEGIKMFIENHPYERISVVAVDHGNSRKEFKTHVRNLGLSDVIKMVPCLTNYKLRSYLAMKKTIVLESFIDSFREDQTFGGIARETLALGGVLINNTNLEWKQFPKMFTPNCPLFPANTPKQIFEQLVKVVNMKKSERESLRRQTLEWSEKNFHWENRIKFLEKSFLDYLENRKSSL